MCVCVGVWVCGCVGVWVCGWVVVWVCGCVGVNVCGLCGIIHCFRFRLCYQVEVFLVLCRGVLIISFACASVIVCN